jgi:hypothetical protein
LETAAAAAKHRKSYISCPGLAPGISNPPTMPADKTFSQASPRKPYKNGLLKKPVDKTNVISNNFPIYFTYTYSYIFLLSLLSFKKNFKDYNMEDNS